MQVQPATVTAESPRTVSTEPAPFSPLLSISGAAAAAVRPAALVDVLEPKIRRRPGVNHVPIETVDGVRPPRRSPVSPASSNVLIKQKPVAAIELGTAAMAKSYSFHQGHVLLFAHIRSAPCAPIGREGAGVRLGSSGARGFRRRQRDARSRTDLDIPARHRERRRGPCFRGAGAVLDLAVRSRTATGALLPPTMRASPSSAFSPARAALEEDDLAVQLAGMGSGRSRAWSSVVSSVTARSGRI